MWKETIISTKKQVIVKFWIKLVSRFISNARLMGIIINLIQIIINNNIFQRITKSTSGDIMGIVKYKSLKYLKKQKSWIYNLSEET